MRKAVRIKEGTAVHRTFRYQPPDPVWAPREHLRRTREEIRAHDPRVALWWGGNRGRWRLMEWLSGQGTWSAICYWEGPNAEYRQPESGAIIRKLESISVDVDVQNERIDAHNAKVSGESGRELRAACYEHARDRLERVLGIRQTFGPGYIRRRNLIAGDSTSAHRKFVTEHLIREWEQRNMRKWEGPGS